MSDYEKYCQGFIGEDIIRNLFKKKKYRFFQADMITKIKEEWYCVEIKRQERFMPPPFEGQGLPKWQIEDRLKFQKETGIRCMFFVVEKPTENILWNYLDNLYNAEKYQTKGDKPRIIFPIVNFKKINLVG